MDFALRAISQVEDVHRTLTYPLFARQIESRMAAGEWFGVEARSGTSVIGFVLVSSKGDGAEILSVAVTREARRRGVASQLIEKVRGTWEQRGGRTLGIRYRADLPNAGCLSGLLAKNGWSVPTPVSEVGRSADGPVAERVRQFAGRFPVKFGARVMAWGEVTAGQYEALVAEQKADVWVPQALMPHLFERRFLDEQMSSAVIVNDRILAWLLVRVAPSVPPKADFCCAFVHPQWQRRGTFLWMLARSLGVLTARYPRFSATWTVAVLRPEVRAFVRRWLAPLGVELNWLLASYASGMAPMIHPPAANLSGTTEGEP